MTEHNTLTGSDLHEPKGASTATSGSVYVSNGAGSGAWEETIGSIHGDAAIIGNATATAVTIAADSTLSTDSDYNKVVAGWSLPYSRGVTLNTDELVISVAGTYLITFWATVKIPLNNNFIGIKYSINDTAPYSDRKVVSQSKSSNDIVNMSASGIVSSLAVNDTLSMYIAGTKTDNLVVQEAGLTVLLLHEA